MAFDSEGEGGATEIEIDGPAPDPALFPSSSPNEKVGTWIDGGTGASLTDAFPVFVGSLLWPIEASAILSCKLRTWNGSSDLPLARSEAGSLVNGTGAPLRLLLPSGPLPDISACACEQEAGGWLTPATGEALAALGDVSGTEGSGGLGNGLRILPVLPAEAFEATEDDLLRFAGRAGDAVVEGGPLGALDKDGMGEELGEGPLGGLGRARLGSVDAEEVKDDVEGMGDWLCMGLVGDVGTTAG